MPLAYAKARDKYVSRIQGNANTTNRVNQSVGQSINQFFNIQTGSYCAVEANNGATFPFFLSKMT